MHRKLIFPDRPTAQRMLGKLATHRLGRRFEIYLIDSKQWQVVEITQCVSAMPPRIPLPIGAAARALAAPPVVKPVELATIRAPFFEQSPKFIVIKGARGVHCFGRGTLTKVEIADGMVTLTLSRKALEKRGLLALAA